VFLEFTILEQSATIGREQSSRSLSVVTHRVISIIKSLPSKCSQICLRSSFVLF
jgi:hypothetical protein